MNFVELEQVWRSPRNRPTAAQVEEMKLKFTDELRRRRRGLVMFLSVIIGVLAVLTGRMLWVVIAANGAGGAEGAAGGAAGGVGGTGAQIDVGREWGALVLLVLPWSAVFFFMREHLRQRRRHAQVPDSIRASLSALIDENRFARARLKWVAVLHGALLILLPLVVYQLRAVGKAGDEVLVPAFVLWPLISVGILLAMRYHDRRKLVPRQRELEAMLRSYE